MAVLVEGISVIIRQDRIIEAFDGDWDAFETLLPNDTLCGDNELMRVGFLSPSDVEGFVECLGIYGLVHLDAGRSIDIVIADQQFGFSAPCDWAEMVSTTWDENPAKSIPACRLKGSQLKILGHPEDWTWDGSLLDDFQFTPSGEGVKHPRQTVYSATHYTTGELEVGEAGGGVYFRSIPRDPKKKLAFIRRFRGGKPTK